jgi:hypothetical protein
MSTEGKGETKINAYSVGDKLDVLDETSTWVVAKILDVVSHNVTYFFLVQDMTK